MASRRGTIAVTMTAQDSDLFASLVRWRQGTSAIAKAMGDVGEKTKQTDQVATSFWAKWTKGSEGAIASAVGLGSAMTAVVTILQQARREYDAFIARKQSASDYLADQGTLLYQAALATGDPARVDELDKFASRVSRKSRVDKSIVIQQAASAFSAAGDLNDAAVLGTVEATAKLGGPLLNDPQVAQAITEGALELQKAFPDQSPDQAVAAVLTAFSAARTVEIPEFATNLVGSIKNVANLSGGKDTMNDLLSYILGFGQAGADKTGQRTSTNAMIQAQDHLDLMIKAGIQGAEQMGLVGRREWLQSNDPRAVAIRNQLVKEGKLKGDARFREPAKGLLFRDSMTMGEIDAAKRKLDERGVGTPESVTRIGETLDEIMKTKSGGAESGRRAKQARGGQFKGIGEGGAYGTARELLRDAMEQAGFFSQEIDARLFKADLISGLSEEKAVAYLEEVARRESLGLGGALKEGAIGFGKNIGTGRIVRQPGWVASEFYEGLANIFRESQQAWKGTAEEVNQAFKETADDIRAVREGITQRGTQEHPAAGAGR